MFAIFEFGGKQYKAIKDLTLKLEKIEGKTKETFFDKVLLVSDENNETIIGSPYVKGYVVFQFCRMGWGGLSRQHAQKELNPLEQKCQKRT